MVYVLNKDGQPLMPTSRYGKVRRLLESNKAKVVSIVSKQRVYHLWQKTKWFLRHKNP